jgi:hypothetical protein
MRTGGTIFSVVLALYGAVKLYLAFRHNGDVDAYLLGVIVVTLGAAMFWRFRQRPQE